MKKLLLILLCIITFNVQAQSKFTFTGHFYHDSVRKDLVRKYPIFRNEDNCRLFIYKYSYKTQKYRIKYLSRRVVYF